MIRRATTCSSPLGRRLIARLAAARAPSAPHLALEREHAQRDLGGEVRVGDRDVGSLPEVADKPQRRGDGLVVDVSGAQRGVHRLADRRSAATRRR